MNAREMTNDDCLFAQALLVEMLNASFRMGFVEALLRSAARLPSGPARVIKEFLKGAGRNLIMRGVDRDDLEEMMSKPVIYESVRRTLARNFRSAWRIREQTGTLTY